MTTNTELSLYPALEPYRHDFLPEKDGHGVYFEECGNPLGVPVLFLHGGPGSGCSPQHRQFFHPTRVRAVLFDQRGCGRSFSKERLKANTTEHLIDDIERLRAHLNIDRWLVVGGSWGGGLGLAYASTFPERCMGAVIRGVFLSRPADLDWFFDGAKQHMPEAWASFTYEFDFRGESPQQFLFDRLLHGGESESIKLALAWQKWEIALTNRNFQVPSLSSTSDLDATSLIAKYRLQSHYLNRLCFFPKNGLLSQLKPISSIPVCLLHGRLDWICLPEAAWAVHQSIPGSRLRIIDNCGHSPFETSMASQLVLEISAMVDQIRVQG